MLEIGAGYGCAALNWCVSGHAKTYTVIDLPDNLMNSIYYLSENLTGWTFNIVDLQNPVSFEENTINFLTPHYIDRLDAAFFDIVVNSDSFGEMPSSVASAYVNFAELHLAVNGILLSKNGHFRTQDGVRFIGELGYHKFDLVKFSYLNWCSSAFDDFSHFFVGKKSKVSTGPSSVNLTVLSQLFKCGLTSDLDFIIEYPLKSNVDFYKECDYFYKTGLCSSFASFMNSNRDLECQIIFDYLMMLHYFVVGDRAMAIKYAYLYLQSGSSEIARCYAYLILISYGTQGLDFSKEVPGVVHYTREFVSFATKNIILKSIFFSARKEHIKEKILYNYKMSTLIKLKNILLNVIQFKSLSFRRSGAVH